MIEWLSPSAWKERSAKDGVGGMYPWKVKERKQARAASCILTEALGMDIKGGEENPVLAYA